MKKIRPTITAFIIALLSFSFINAQKNNAYVKFAKAPQKKLIISELNNTEFIFEFKSKKEATFYFELRKNGKSVANAIHTGKSRKPVTVKLSLRKYDQVRLIPGANYSYYVYMFEGPRDTWTKQIGDSTEISGVKISRLK